MEILSSITSPRDLDSLTEAQLDQLAGEIRHELVDKVAKSGGHLGPNLGVVELTIALHRVFESPKDALIWDTGHQSYVHKMLTGRTGDFDSLRKSGGLSGYPSKSESPHDVIENSHASTSLSYADGFAKAWALKGQLAPFALSDRHVVAVIGDGALTGGMAWEALNNIAASDRQVIIVVNDNARSYAPTIGGLAEHLNTLRTAPKYERFLNWGKGFVQGTPIVGEFAYEAIHGIKKGLKDVFTPQGMFEDLGLKYVGPIDGHDIESLETALHQAKDFPGPVIIHAITQKGRGYAPAEQDESDHFHGIGVINPGSGKPVNASTPSWTSVFSDELVAIGKQDPNVVAITAAMLGPTGLGEFASRFPERTFDVGIAEQQAVTSATAMAMAGMHPVVAVYSTFMNRAFDQVLLDAGMHKASVTFVLDRAGVTGPDGASHHGMWDMSLFSLVPGIRIAAPRDEQRLRSLLNESVAISDGPSIVRFPSGPICEEVEAVRNFKGVDILHESDECDVLLVAVGSTATMCVDAAHRAGLHKIGVTVVDPKWVAPLNPALVELAQKFNAVVTVEDGLETSGVGSQIIDLFQSEQCRIPVRRVGIPSVYLEHGDRSTIADNLGLTAQHIARTIVEAAASSTDGLGKEEESSVSVDFDDAATTLEG